MAGEPSRLVGQQIRRVEEEQEDSDLDAEGEEDEDLEVYHSASASNAVKIPDQVLEDEAVESESSAFEANSEGESEDAVTESDPENAWEAQSDAEEVEAEIVDPNRCVFCGQDEEHDPSEEFEEYLACAVCGDNAHRQCARDANSLGPDDDAKRWRCTTCVDNGLEEDTNINDNAEDASRRRSSVGPKVARELLPGHRGAVKPDSHSVFNHLILDDDPMDGSRSLRKRKASDEVEVHTARPSRKRRRPSEAASASAGAHASIASSPRTGRDVSMSEEIAVNGDHGDVEDDESPQVRSVRSRRRKNDKALCHIVSAEGVSIIVAFSLDRDKMDKILSSRPRKSRARDRSRKKIQPPPPIEPEVSHYPGIQSGFSTQLLAMTDRDQDESKSKPYGGILSELEADTSKTFPMAEDRNRFEEARLKAEEDWKKKMATTAAMQEASRASQKVSGPPSKIKCINFGGFEIDTWNAAPFPEEYSRNRLLYICEFCLKYMNSDYVAWRHKLKCPAKHPPGDEIYRDGSHSFFEVDGRKNPVYCQNLCLLAKLFLGSKTLYYDVEPFLFYVMTENDEFGCHFVGYFSKEKRPSSMNNVSCILVLPIFQRRGFGHMLIDFSYLLTKREQKVGSPEKPLSDMGLVSYRGYWRLTLCQLLLKHKTPISITRISELTGMTPDDIISALEALRALVRDPITKSYALRVDHAYFKEYIEKQGKKNYPQINPDVLIWTPYVMNRGLTSHYEEGGPMHAVAPREEEDTEDGALRSPVDNGGTQLLDEATRFAKALITNGDPSHGSGSKSPGHTPTTPLPNGNDHITSTPYTNIKIPPNRFEVFPPVPGMAANKRRPGRPFGSRTRHKLSGGTPNGSITGTAGGGVRRNPVGFQTGSPASGNRRMRSMLGEEVANGVDDGAEAKGEDEITGQEKEGDGDGDGGGEEENQEEEDAEEDAEGEDDEEVIVGKEGEAMEVD
ncbi:hypothetical protein EJ08DRAFT_646561 [Tothia fuscella]|uniref:Histone acetyltransferase n=1 Tax=Tothia fuscella TaxID=1048955 RepID=A0A9P4U354_9PEZI|nr:hypothetical protein EJ08DRAFT_646561 [Tothia fuscella]